MLTLQQGNAKRIFLQPASKTAVTGRFDAFGLNSVESIIDASGLVGAYSTRRLFRTYKGPNFRIQRDTDGALADVWMDQHAGVVKVSEVTTSGGTETLDWSRLHTFVTSGTLTVTKDDTVDVLVVAGGGGGSTVFGGGGGGGGVAYKANRSISPGSISVTVGAGGSSAPRYPNGYSIKNDGTGGPQVTTYNGGDSIFGDIVAVGGGSGGGDDAIGMNGGSGGGGSDWETAYGGSALQPSSISGGYGNSGGDGVGDGMGGGGGGGAGTKGANAEQELIAGRGYGHGGHGKAIDITGQTKYYGGGGGGVRKTVLSSSKGGYGGGGDSNHLGNGFSGESNTGGGGGGSYNAAGGEGGSGVVIVRVNGGMIGRTALITWLNGATCTVTKWYDQSSSQNHVTLVRGNPRITTDLATGNYLYGTIADGIRWPTAILPATYTLLHTARYAGTARQRIFDGVTGDWLSGFANEQSGVAYHNGWITSQENRHGDNLVVSVDQNQPNRYRSNGVDHTTVVNVNADSVQLSINYGASTTTYSDWILHEVLVFNTTVPLPALQTIERNVILRYLGPVDGITLNARQSCRAVYALRKLVGRYAGPIVGIRRGSDNKTADVYYDRTGKLRYAVDSDGKEWVGESAFYGGWLNDAVGFIHTWYDQSGNNRHATQNVIESQPSLKIIDFGKGVMLDFRISRFLSMPDGTVPIGNTPYTFVVQHGTIDSSTATLIASGSSSTDQANILLRSGTAYQNTWWLSSNDFLFGANANANNVVACSYDGALLSGYINQAAVSTQATTGSRNATSSNNRIGIRWDNVDPLNGDLYYVGIFETALVAADISAFTSVAPTLVGANDGLTQAVPVGAYSIRLLNGSYVGPLVRVRRSTDNVQADVYADARGIITSVVKTNFLGSYYGNQALAQFQGDATLRIVSWYDQSGNGRNMTPSTNAPTLQLPSWFYLPNLVGSTLSHFYNTSFTCPASYTKMCWIYATIVAGNLISRYSTVGSLPVHYLFYPSGGLRLSAGHSTINSINVAVQDPVNTPTNTWIHFAVTYDQATLTMRMYRNATVVSQAVNRANLSWSGGGAISVGIYGHNSTGNNFTGYIAHAKIYDYALTASEIANIYRVESTTVST